MSEYKGKGSFRVTLLTSPLYRIRVLPARFGVKCDRSARSLDRAVRLQASSVSLLVQGKKEEKL